MRRILLPVRPDKSRTTGPLSPLDIKHPAPVSTADVVPPDPKVITDLTDLKATPAVKPSLISPKIGGTMIKPLQPEVSPQFTKTIDQVLSGTPPVIRDILKNAIIEPTLRTYCEFVTNLGERLLGLNAREKVLFLAHVLAIITNESSGNPSAAYIEKSASGNKFVGAYGYFQFRRTTWKDMIKRVLPNSGILEFIKNSGIGNYLARTFNVNVFELMAPDSGVHRTPNALPIFQIMPMLAFTYELERAVKKYWTFVPNVGWRSRVNPTLLGGAYRTFIHEAKSMLDDYHEGKQAIMTASHTNGPGFWRSPTLAHMDRIKKDVRTFKVIENDPGFKQVLAYATAAPQYIKNGMAMAMVNTGDPVLTAVRFDDSDSGIEAVTADPQLGPSYLLIRAHGSTLVAPTSCELVGVVTDPTSGSFRMNLLLPNGYKLEVTLSPEWTVIPGFRKLVPTKKYFINDGETIAQLNHDQSGASRFCVYSPTGIQVDPIQTGIINSGLTLSDMFILI